MLLIFLFVAIAITTGASHRLTPGSPLSVQSCRTGDDSQALSVHADSTVRSGDNTLCVTLPDSPFPSSLTMELCSTTNSRAQTWERVGSSFQTTNAAGECVAWNTVTDTLFISSYTCSSIAWNGYFTPSGNAIYANFTAPTTPVPAGSYCVSAEAQPTCPADQCTDDTDCNLNGVCSTDGTCTCYKPWGGVTCGELQFLPIAAPAVTNGYPGATSNETTWGGNAIFYDGLYHLFVAEMVNNCSLAQWGTNSRCAHAVSSTPEGPYARSDIAVDLWCHNPQVSYIPGGGAGGADLWALWHIGSGTGGHPATCAPNGNVIIDAAAGTPAAAVLSAGGSPLHVANSPYGPWTPVLEPQPSCNNPTQFRHSNGTWFLVCDSFQLYSGPNVTGPWNYILDIPRGGTPGIFEDGFLYIDTRGNWHQFFHTCAWRGGEESAFVFNIYPLPPHTHASHPRPHQTLTPTLGIFTQTQCLAIRRYAIQLAFRGIPFLVMDAYGLSHVYSPISISQTSQMEVLFKCLHVKGQNCYLMLQVSRRIFSMACAQHHTVRL